MKNKKSYHKSLKITFLRISIKYSSFERYKHAETVLNTQKICYKKIKFFHI